MTWQPPQLRLLAVTGAVVFVVSAGGCDRNEQPTGGGETPSPTASAKTRGPGLPPVVSAVPQPDPVAATMGRTVTVRGLNLFGTQSATIEVTLSAPKVITGAQHPNGVVQKPEREVFVVFDVVIEGVEGTYSFNPLHFYLMPSGEVATWRSKAVTGLGQRTDGPTSIDVLKSLRPGSISSGDRLSGTIVFDQPRAAVTNAAIVLRALLLPDGGAAAYWTLP